MDPRRNDNTLPFPFLSLLSSVTISDLVCVCYGEELTGDAGDGLAEDLPIHELAPAWVALNRIQVRHQVCVRIRIAVSEKDRILVVLKSVSECTRVKVFRESEVLANLVLEVGYIRTAPMPANLFLFRFLFRVDGDLHAVVKHRICLVVVEDVEFDG